MHPQTLSRAAKPPTRLALRRQHAKEATYLRGREPKLG